MKQILKLMIATTLILSPALAAGDHHHPTIPGPLGGKILDSEPLHAEFWVQSDRKVRVTFYNESMKPVPPQSQEIKVIAEAKSGKTILEFEQEGVAFLSKSPLPKGEGYRVVVQIKKEPSAKPQNFRIDFHEEICKGCKYAEYACICEHANDTEHKH